MVSDYTLEKYIDYLKRVEGFANKVGEIYYPYDSPEGGLKTIGYGYKIKTLSEQNALDKAGMTQREVDTKLNHEAIISYQKAKNYCYTKNVKRKTVHDRMKYALSDYCFNLGSLKKFPTTAKCLMNNDVKGAMDDDPTREGFQHYERIYTDPVGNKVRLGRNKTFYNEFLEPYLEKK